MSKFYNTLRLMNLKHLTVEHKGGVSLWICAPIIGNQTFRHSVLEVSDKINLDGLAEVAAKIEGVKERALFHSEDTLLRFRARILDMGFGQISTIRGLLFEGIQGLLGARQPMELPRALVEPALLDKSNSVTNLCTIQIAEWLRNEKSSPLAIISGPAGFGKTTICEILVNRFVAAIELNRVPLFISSTHWRRLVEGHRVTIRSIFLEAVASTYSQAALGDEMIEYLISEGAIVPIFDGLDEICTDAYTEISVSEIVDQLDDIFADSPHARALFTTRSTFWSAAKPSDRLHFQEYAVEPFDVGRRGRFLDNWFVDNISAKEKAHTLLKRIEGMGRIRSGGGDLGYIRFSESPYILHLVSIAAEEQRGFGFGEDSWANFRDPLDAILGALATREVRKNRIETEVQNRILYSLALTFGEAFSVDDMSEIVNLYTEEGQRLDGMFTHHVLTGAGGERAFLFNGLGDYMRAKAVASWIFREDENLLGIEDYLNQITSVSDNSVDLFGDISGFYGDAHTVREAFRQGRIRRFFRSRSAQGLIFLLIAAMREQKVENHEELRDLVSNIFLGGEEAFTGLDFSGQFENMSFAGRSFVKCEFQDVVLRNCDFDERSTFKDCRFVGNFAAYGCPGFELITLDSVNVSPEAKAVFARRNVKGSDRRVSESDIAFVLDGIFAQLQNADMTYHDMNREGLISRIQKKNSYIAVDVIQSLEKHGVIVAKRSQVKHRNRVGVGKPEDVIAFHREGALVRSMRDVMNDLLERYN